MIELEGKRRVLYQWELNKRIVIDGFTAGTIVEFSVKHDGKDSALLVKAYAEDDHIYADIPNSMLQKHGYIRAYVRPSANAVDHDPAVKDIKVTRREKPEDYFYTETPGLSYEELAKRVTDLEGEGIANAVADYLKKNPIESGATVEEAAQIQQNKTDIEKLAQDKMDANKLPEAVNEALAQAKTSGLFDGADGQDGKDGYTPVKGVDYFDGKDGKDGKDGYTPQKGVDYFDGKDGKDGNPGADGKTPVKGEDYFTEDDKQEITNAVIAALPKYNGEVVAE